jgi:hypothetical protein
MADCLPAGQAGAESFCFQIITRHRTTGILNVDIIERGLVLSRAEAQ